MSETTQRTHKASQSTRERVRTTNLFEGRRVCRETFEFFHK